MGTLENPWDSTDPAVVTIVIHRRFNSVQNAADVVSRV
jgi:hypothetical protein